MAKIEKYEKLKSNELVTCMFCGVIIPTNEANYILSNDPLAGDSVLCDNCLDWDGSIEDYDPEEID